MMNKILAEKLRLPALVLIAAAVMATPSFAENLVALKATATMPDGNAVPMWGFFADTGQACTDVPVWQVGPTLTATAGGTLTINLRNCLAEPISVFIPGQYKVLAPVSFLDTQGRQRARSFDLETAPGTVRTYVWNTIKAGTYLYHSGTHPQKQVQMGLYGALKVGSYPGVTADVTLVYSEIDPSLHAAVAGGTYGTPAYPSTFDYQPKYFLINGKSYPDTAPIAVDLSSNVLLRFVNAGLKTHTPTLQGLYMTLIAEDGNLYPFTREQYSTELPAAKTIDAILNVGTAGRYALYDRDLHVTNAAATGGGMLTYIQAGTAAGAPTAVNDAYTVAEDTTLVVPAASGVLFNDTDLVVPGPSPLSAVLVALPSAGTVALNTDGSFTYTPYPNFNGPDSFTYKASDGVNLSNLATVAVTVTPVNDPPVAAADAYNAVVGQILNVPAPGVLANDSDVDGNTLTAVLVSGPTSGTLTLNANGSFSFTPAAGALVGSTASFTYKAKDTLLDSNIVTVTITIVATPTNVPPFANDDSASTPKNTAVTFSVTANDVDADGTIAVATVDLNPTAALRQTTVATQFGGTATVDNLGNVTFTPKNGFRGTDTFTYTVKDNAGATSNTATVRVNVL